MRLVCDACHSPLRAQDVRFDLALATCHACNAVYDLSGRKTRLTRPKAARPERIQEQQLGQSTVLSWRWFKPRYVPMALFCAFWDGTLLTFYGAMFAAMFAHGSSALLCPMLFTLPHLSIGLVITYSTLAGLLNRTRIEVSRDTLSIQYGPLPWPGSHTWSGHELTQLYCQEVRPSKAAGIFSLFKRRATFSFKEWRPFLWSPGEVTYGLFAIDRQGRRVMLLSSIEDKDQVLYLEQALERQLGIEDSPVDGELAIRDHVT